jgi:esterase FrsA
MNDVDELKRFVIVHARAQNIVGYQDVLRRISHDNGDEPGSWAREWSRSAELLAGRGRLLEATRHYSLARFPYVDGPARQQALTACTLAFDQWRQADPAIQRLDVDLPDGRVRGWATGLSAVDPKPLLVIMGGIVTVKEQWAPVLRQVRRLGMAGIVTEMPGAGENELRYDANSWRMLSGLLDTVGDQADVTRTYTLAMSFSGHMALRCALSDNRIRGIVTAGAPVTEFFTDTAWQRDLPRVTVDTLAHLSGTKLGDMRDWALTPTDLSALDIPVHCAVSLRDEIIPAGDVQQIRRWVRQARFLEHDDVHGSPSHVVETRLWSILSLLRMRGGNHPRRAAIAALLGMARLRRRPARSTS